MAFAAFGLLLVLGVAATLGGRRFPSERRTLGAVIAGGALVVVSLKLVEIAVPDVELGLQGSDLAVYVERDFAIPAAALFFAIAARLVPDARNRRAVGVVPWLLLAYLVFANLWTLREPDCYASSIGLWNQGVCIQSTDYTCGAASIATVTSLLGAPLREHEAARLSRTEPFRGVTDLGCAMALRHHFPDRRVRIQTVAVSSLATVPLPCLAPTRDSVWFDHMMTVLAVEPGSIVLGDPLRGRIRKTPAELEAIWKGRVITVEPAGH